MANLAQIQKREIMKEEPPEFLLSLIDILVAIYATS